MKRYLIPLAAALVALLALGLTFAKAQEVRFYTSATCGPCQLAKPKMQQLAREGIAVRFIDVSNGAPAHITRVPAYEYVDASGRVVDSWLGDAPVTAIRRIWNGGRKDPDYPPATADSNTIASRVCRIRVEYRGGQYRQGNYYGTGCYVTNGDETYIQSCAHNFEPSPGERIVGITAHFPGGINVRCKLINSDEKADLAKLQPESQLPFDPLVATGEMQHGESVSWYGYGKAWSLRTGSGESDTSQLANGYGNIIPRTGPQVVQGDSGGPIVNDKGEVVGVLFGFSEENGQVYLACRKTFRSFFGIQRSVQRQVVRPAPTQAPPRQVDAPPRDCGCRDKFAKIHAELASCIERIDRMEKLAGEAREISAEWEADVVARLESRVGEHLNQMTCEPGPQGPPGPRGPQGEPGKDGKDAAIDEDALAERVAQIVLAQIDVPQPDEHAKYYVLVADNEASYWDRLSGQLKAAQEGYSKIKVAQPPNYSVGALPQLVEYQSGKPLRTIAGSHNVSTALSYLARGANP